MGNLKPFIFSEDARTQAEFYMQSLGGEIMSVITHGEAMGAQNEFKDKVMHMCLVVAGGNAIFMADSVEPFTQGTGISLNVEFKSESEAVDAFAKLAAGSYVKHPIGMQPYGLVLGELIDKYGIRWMITAQPKANRS